MTARSIRSSYSLTFPRICRELTLATVTEIPRPVRVVVDGKTGVLKCEWRTK